MLFILTYLCFIQILLSSQYVGNQSLYFGDLTNTLFTIFRMTFIGLGFKYWNSFTYLTIFKSITLSAIISYSTFLFLKKIIKYTHLKLRK